MLTMEDFSFVMGADLLDTVSTGDMTLTFKSITCMFTVLKSEFNERLNTILRRCCVDAAVQ